MKKYNIEELLELQASEDIFQDNNKFVILPISEKYKDIWDLYNVHLDAFWRADDIDYTADARDWESLDDNHKHFIEMILAFFAASDGIVNENLSTNFIEEIQISEIRTFYSWQSAMENIHGLTYSKLIEAFVKTESRRQKLFHAIETIPAIKKKADWTMKWMNKSSGIPFIIRLIAFAIVEGVFFSGAFCAIFWLKSKGLMCRSLGHSNEFISRDEGLHTQCAILILKHMLYHPNEDIVHNIFKEAVEIEKEFICDSIKCDMIGMNSKLMGNYIEFVANRLLIQMDYSPLYEIKKCPFDFMLNIGIDTKTNFHENRVSEYKNGSHIGVKHESFVTELNF